MFECSVLSKSSKEKNSFTKLNLNFVLTRKRFVNKRFYCNLINVESFCKTNSKCASITRARWEMGDDRILYQRRLKLSQVAVYQRININGLAVETVVGIHPVTGGLLVQIPTLFVLVFISLGRTLFLHFSSSKLMYFDFFLLYKHSPSQPELGPHCENIRIAKIFSGFMLELTVSISVTVTLLISFILL